MSFNCLFLRYLIKTGEMECLILNKSIGRDGKRVCHTERTFLDSILEKICLDLLIYSKKKKGHMNFLSEVSTDGCCHQFNANGNPQFGVQ